MERCIIHQIRSSARYVSYKDIKALMADLKPVYQAINENEGLMALLRFTEKWEKQYPSCVKKCAIWHLGKLENTGRFPVEIGTWF